ncbi:MAG: DUF1918 domain-containing protein [Acidimicrobiia bacterium]
MGVPPRRGTVLEVRGEPGHEHYVVRWDDGHESVFYPAGTAHSSPRPSGPSRHAVSGRRDPSSAQSRQTRSFGSASCARSFRR